ncbi:MAG: hypothetical protein EOP88_05735 [Verrucomicrobiaceae bacterium]|nr:MAG: hypothetical protein EOP88_05735 [Verrucomicrobiaceae bacterium]
MSSQLSLFDNEPPSARQKSSLFVAFVPDGAAIQRIVECRERLAESHGYLGKQVSPELLHITLVWISDYEGDLPPRVVRDTSAACAAVAAEFDTFEIRLKRVGFYRTKPGSYPLVMKGDEGCNPRLMEFQESLVKQLALRGVSRKEPGKKFDPHLTLSRGGLELAEPVAPVSWIAGEVVLLRSLSGQGKYVTLDKWRLSGG